MESIKEQLYNAFSIDICDQELKTLDTLREDFGGLDKLSEREQNAYDSYKDDWMLRFVYNSNAIEGSTLSLLGTQFVLDGEFPPHNEQNNLRDVFAAIGTMEGYEYMLESQKVNRKIDQDFYKDLHAKIALDCQPRTRGVFRTWNVRIRGSQTVPVDYSQVRESIQDLLYFYDKSKQHPVLKAASLHAMFERIHPFGDGNGRVGRTILNYSLLQSGYLDIAIKYDNKIQYFKSLEEWQINDNPLPFVELVIKSEEKELLELNKIRTDCSAKEFKPKGLELKTQAKSQPNPGKDER